MSKANPLFLRPIRAVFQELCSAGVLCNTFVKGNFDDEDGNVFPRRRLVRGKGTIT